MPEEVRLRGSEVRDGLLPPRKYVSVFRINGEPIIPPLMTLEKRREMQILKEKAIKIEQRLKHRQLRGINDLSLELSSDTSSNSQYHTEGENSHSSGEYYETNQKESEESIMILQDILRHQYKDENVMNFPKVLKDAKDKLKKLQKSETLIYDNSTNEVIKQVPENCEPSIPSPKASSRDQKSDILLYESLTNDEEIDEGIPPLSGQQSKISLRELERRANLNYIKPLKPSHLLLAGITDIKGITIPSICLNPPTPLVGTRPICPEPPGSNESNDGGSERSPHQQRENLSSDESNNSMHTQCDSSGRGIPRSNKIHNFKEAYNNPSNVSSKIQKFESICSDHSTTSSPSKTMEGQKNLEVQKKMSGPAVFSRSATSPSIKLSPSPIRCETSPDRSESSQDTSLVRSSSFTLETPSKALMDHLRQQHTKGNITNRTMTIQPIPPLKVTSAPSRVHRDTVESKAKRVQKMEPKPLRHKIQQKVTQNKTSQNSFHNSPSPSFSGNSTSNLYKSKKSPYDTPSSTRSVGHSAKPVRRSPNNLSTMLTNQKLNNSKPKPTTFTNPPRNRASDNTDPTNQMDKMQRDQFLLLLKHQEQEQKKLRQTFEMQQKLLLEQLKQEMDVTLTTAKTAMPAKSQDPNHSSLSKTLISNNISACNELATGFTSASTQNSQPQDEEYRQQINPSTPHNTIVESEMNNTIDQSCDQFPQVPSLPISDFPSDSNANSSLETTLPSGGTTVSNQTTMQRLNGMQNIPETPTSTPTPIENGLNSINDGSFSGCGIGRSLSSSSSRRRLFTPHTLPGQLVATQPQFVIYNQTIPTQHINENLLHYPQQQPLQQPSLSNAKKVPVVIGNNTNIRRPLVTDHLTANIAATKINACVRGFLVRRLFRTEQIQRIVQTIRDTLIFVLNLHLETCENPSEGSSAANIKLKARLLQQLSSATRTLHLVFFQTSIKERMDIIARDRKRIQTKLLAKKRQRTPRIAG